MAAEAATPVPRIHGLQYDSPGPDDRSPESLDAEYLTLINDSAEPVDLTGWTVRDAQGKVYRFGTVRVKAKGQLRLSTGKGRDTADKVHWNSGNYVWNNTGDTATLRDAAGRAVDSCAWKQARRSWVSC